VSERDHGTELARQSEELALHSQDLAVQSQHLAVRNQEHFDVGLLAKAGQAALLTAFFLAPFMAPRVWK
jgi:hypothetical protein